MKINQSKQTAHFFLIAALVVIAGLMLAACGGSRQDDTFVIGMISETDALSVTFEGLKDGLSEMGYVEGDTVIFIDGGIVGTDAEATDRVIEELLAQDVDMIYSLGTAPALRANLAIEGTDIPHLFAPVISPIAEGVVNSLDHPGMNVTGVQTGDSMPKSFEWLITIAQVSTVYAPYHPDDMVSVISIETLRETAAALGVDIIVDEVTSSEEVVAAIEALPEDTAVFLVPVPGLESGLDDYAAAALENDVPIGAYQPAYMRDGVLVNFSVDLYQIGKQAARLVDQIAQGINAENLPIETADGYLTVNLVTAEAIGIDISDDVLRQAETIIR
jgi:putative ABC transport system substrate-binding protein